MDVLNTSSGDLFVPILPIKGSVLFPYVVMPLAIARSRSRAAVDAAMHSEDKEIIVVAQRDTRTDEPTADDLYLIGTKALLRTMRTSTNGTVNAVVQGQQRVRISKLAFTGDYMRGVATPYPLVVDHVPEVEALAQEIIALTEKAVSLAQGDSDENIRTLLPDSKDVRRLLYTVASLLGMDVVRGQELLEASDLLSSLRTLHGFLRHEVQVLEVRHEIASQAASTMSRERREYLLRQQLREIQEELGEADSDQAEIQLLRERFEQSDLPDPIRKETQRELSRLERLPAAAPEYHVIRTYMDFVLELPWKKSSHTQVDLTHARNVLEADHYGLRDVKQRILEHLAVLRLNPHAKSLILCFVGAPGVGKTSLGQSIARALGREFERMSLGGLHDEAELRGHRRTYVGAMPGRILQAIKRAGVNNPVIMLDEVDKIGHDFRGDPAAALLEILDPEQNHAFRDNYLDLPFDLSNVVFVATANTTDPIPRALLDRMAVIRLPGYTLPEKEQIAIRFLLPRQLKDAGLTQLQCDVSPEVIRYVISRYTREAGVRQLERTISRLTRKVALAVADGITSPTEINIANLPELLGPEPFHMEQVRKDMPAGVAAGVAWTEAGGDVLYVEAALLPGRKGLTLTGQLGDVMQESAKAADTCVWSRAQQLGIHIEDFKDTGVHVHVPSGAIPKDGPSAGVTIATALVSMYLNCPIRSDIAMTGEVTITGLVLPVGGIKEKLLAARRVNMTRLILPKDNEKDLIEVDADAKQGIELIFAERIEDVWAAAIPALHDITEHGMHPTHNVHSLLVSPSGAPASANTSEPKQLH